MCLNSEHIQPNQLDISRIKLLINRCLWILYIFFQNVCFLLFQNIRYFEVTYWLEVFQYIKGQKVVTEVQETRNGPFQCAVDI